MSNIKTVGIIGLGSFGALTGRLLQNHVQVLGYSRSGKRIPGVTPASFEETAHSDIVVLAVPLPSYETVLQQLAPVLPATSLLVDVCSVKVYPAQLIKKYLPNHQNVLMTHPLFGPETIKDKTAEHIMVITERHGERAQAAEVFCANELGLTISHTSAEEHDKQMAKIHALTYFIARGLTALNVNESALGTPSYQSLLQLTSLDQKHTQELFETIENGNPYAAAIRKEYLEALQKIDSSLEPSPGLE